MEESNLSVWRKDLVETIRFLHGWGWAPATSSNYSFRLPGEPSIYISRSGIDKGKFSEEHLLTIDEQGKPTEEPDSRPSAETLLHLLIYRLAPETRAVLHTHTVYNTVLSMAHESEGKLLLSGYELLKAIAGITTHETMVEIPIFANRQEMEPLAEEIGAYWDEHPNMKAFLLAGHGLYTWGATIGEAKRQIEALEFLFECQYKRKQYHINS